MIEKVLPCCTVVDSRLRKTRLRWFGHVRRRNANSILKSAMELEVESRS